MTNVLRDEIELRRQYGDIVEVFEARGALSANDYLAHGYELLRIEGVTFSGRHPEQPAGAAAGGYITARALRYVMGRRSDVEHYAWVAPNRGDRHATPAETTSGE